MIRSAELELPDGAPHPLEPPPPPDSGKVREFFATGQALGYHTAMEIRFLRGGFLEAGPASACCG